MDADARQAGPVAAPGRRPPPLASHPFFERESDSDLLSQLGTTAPTSIGSLMLDSTQSSGGAVTKPSSKSVAQTIDGLSRVIADRGFTVFNPEPIGDA